MKKQKKEKYLFIGIIIVALLDAFSTTIGTIPVIGDILTIGSNFVYELIELVLVFGLIGIKENKF